MICSHDRTSIKLPGVEVPLTESLTSSFDLRIDDRLAKLRLDLAAEISENLRKLRLNFSERFQNIERKTHHPSSSDLRLVMMMAQQYHEKCLNMELNIMRLRDEMLSQMPNKQSLNSILTNFERKGNTRLISFTSTNVKLRLRFVVHLTFHWHSTWHSPEPHLTTWPSSDLPLTLK